MTFDRPNDLLALASAFPTPRFGRLASLFAALLAVCVAGPAALAAPQPDPVPRRWQLDVEPGPLRMAVVDIPDEGPRPFFYFTYYVENNTGQDLLFAPSFELAAEDGQLRRSGRNVPTVVTEEIMRRLENPLLLDQIAIVGTLLQGAEHAKEGLVVWPAENLRVDEIAIFAAGFSGETKTYTRPTDGQEVLLRKTLVLRHLAPGELTGVGDTPLDRVEQRWIMR